MMKRAIASIAVVCSSACHGQQTDAQTLGLSASSIALQCATVLRERVNGVDAAICFIRMESFVRGWRDGATRGARIGLIYDDQAAATTQGIADLQRRVAMLRPIARCLPDALSVYDLIDQFVEHVKTHPADGTRVYDDVLSVLIQDTYCPPSR